MIQSNTKLRYFLYARKSTESEDRQVQSIDDQVNRLKELADTLNLSIKKVYTESKSAKKPDNRPLFSEMMERIEQGEAEGILCWQINRLSRNPIDSGKVSWLLQKGIIKSIQTIDRQFLPEDNVLMFSVESGMANQFLLDLSKNVKRGIQSKLDKGWRPGSAPTGYANDLANHTIIEDPERFALIRKAWDVMFTGNFTVAQILDMLNNEWGFRSIKKRHSGGSPLALSGLYKIFTSLFYAGIILHKGQQYPGQHKPMVSLEEFDHVQIVLGRKGKPRSQKHSFAFTGAIRCGECGCFYTAETKRKLIKTTGKVKSFTYYHCTRRTLRVKCTQRKVVPEEKLQVMIENELDKYTILPEFLQWALDGLTKKNDVEIEARTKIYEMRHKDLMESQKELDELTKMRYRQLIDDETFLKEKTELQAKIAQTRSQLRETETRAEKWLELTENTFKFAAYARKEFLAGGLELKKEILLGLGKTPTIIDGTLTIEPDEWFVPIKEGYPELEKEYLGLELDKKPLDSATTAALTAVITRWQGLSVLNQRFERFTRRFGRLAGKDI